MDCVDCKNRRCCKIQAEYLAAVFFSIGTGERPSCSECEPAYYHGIEGVAA